MTSKSSAGEGHESRHRSCRWRWRCCAVGRSRVVENPCHACKQRWRVEEGRGVGKGSGGWWVRACGRGECRGDAREQIWWRRAGWSVWRGRAHLSLSLHRGKRGRAGNGGEGGSGKRATTVAVMKDGAKRAEAAWVATVRMATAKGGCGEGGQRQGQRRRGLRC